MLERPLRLLAWLLDLAYRYIQCALTAPYHACIAWRSRWSVGQIGLWREAFRL